MHIISAPEIPTNIKLKENADEEYEYLVTALHRHSFIIHRLSK